jgi:hypothetical protein
MAALHVLQLLPHVLLLFAQTHMNSSEVVAASATSEDADGLHEQDSRRHLRCCQQL